VLRLRAVADPGFAPSDLCYAGPVGGHVHASLHCSRHPANDPRSGGNRRDGSRASDADDIAGWAVEAAGDVNADGFPDLVVGAPRAITVGGTNDGVAWIASGRFLATGVGPARIHSWDGNPYQAQTPSRFGHTLAGGRDVDLDGVPDVVVGSPNDDSGGIMGGSVSVYSGATGARIGFEVASHYQLLGTSMAFAGDVNGDGWVDVIGGAPVSDTTFGVAYVHAHVYSGEWMARTAAGQTPVTPAELHDLVGLYNHDDCGALFNTSDAVSIVVGP